MINSRFSKRSAQQGLTSVEFSIVGLAAMIILFGSVEMSRLMFTLNALEEATRRGARVAAVCEVNDVNIARAAVFNSSGSGSASPVIRNLTTDNIQVQYLSANGDDITADIDDETVFTTIEYVRVQIVGFQHEMIIPGFGYLFDMPAYPTTLPAESLGIYKTAVSSCVWVPEPDAA